MPDHLLGFSWSGLCVHYFANAGSFPEKKCQHTTSMPVIDIGALFIGREDREGDDGSGVATEDDDDTDAEAGGYARDFLEVILRRLWEGRFGKRRTTT